ncbi:hypothetical protein CapIbe_012529 [Capra ibex]
METPSHPSTRHCTRAQHGHWLFFLPPELGTNCNSPQMHGTAGAGPKPCILILPGENGAGLQVHFNLSPINDLIQSGSEGDLEYYLQQGATKKPSLGAPLTPGSSVGTAGHPHQGSPSHSKSVRSQTLPPFELSQEACGTRELGPLARSFPKPRKVSRKPVSSPKELNPLPHFSPSFRHTGVVPSSFLPEQEGAGDPEAGK